MTSPFHISRGLDVCIQPGDSSDSITVTPSTRMRPSTTTCSGSTLPLLSLLWLALAVHLAQSWGWGPYDSEWRKHIEPAAAHHAELVYRVVVPRNGSTPALSGTGSVPLSTARPIPVTNSSVDTSCGEDSPLYNLQVSRADGSIFDGWWLKLSGNQALFTLQKDKATGFGVNQGTKHLCIPKAGRDFPLIAIVETRLGLGPLYFLDANFSTGYRPEYEPVVCDSLSGHGSQLLCAQGTSTRWSGCGLQLELGTGTGTDSNDTGSGSGQNCSSIALNAFQASNSALF
ncbi:hypothetical protein DHEL01_v205979 [Diaporthe helianthi]|uniref:Uncharacterized protein n=1 Tax=Diaporthe helianthi TaxID=158607 RepID=A0A2P5HZD0_DIAHE|nr:hypothetical protein DHEL01_v205979 [Diaporthe helianthi]